MTEENDNLVTVHIRIGEKALKRLEATMKKFGFRKRADFIRYIIFQHLADKS